MRIYLPVLFLASFGFGLTSSSAAIDPTAEASIQDGLSIWTITETRRVVRDDLAGGTMAVNLAAARNEWEGFQILVRSDTPVDGLTIEAGDLSGPAGALIAAESARLYRQHQVEITEGSWRNYTFVPGWYSDGLIPFKHPLTGNPLGGAEYTAVPFALPADQTHGFWVDVPIPAAGAPGAYMGTYLVKDGETELATIPVQLTVWDFELPGTPTLRTDFGSPKDVIKIYYEYRAQAGIEPEPVDYDAVRLQCNEMMARHGLSAFPKTDQVLVEPQPDGSYRIPQAQVDAMQTFIDTYHGNSVRVPTHTRSPTGLILWLSYYGIEDEIPQYLAAWDDAIARIDRPHVSFYNYLVDEPNDLTAYDYVRNWGTQLRATGSAVEVLVVEQTLPQPNCGGDMYGAVSIWCPAFATYDETNAHARQAVGEHIWTYTALSTDDYTPKWLTDFPLIEYRAPAWTAWRFDIEGLLYWTVAYWHLNLDLPPDPWTDPKTFENEWKGHTYIYNRDGCIVYPGRKVGYEGIAPSIRLKALRDSVEDYEYLAILERMGLEAEAMSIVQPLTTSWYDWVSDPAAYEQARIELAEMIVSHALPGDMNRDGWIDASDFELFQACFTGPGGGPIEPTCGPSDFDGDDDLDCADWLWFVSAWNGHGEPPGFAPCDAAVPALSTWGIVAMTLCILTAGTLIHGRRRPVTK